MPDLRRVLLALFKATILAVSLVWLLPPSPLRVAEGALALPWRTALTLASDQGLRFGSDFVFAYGPLSVLSARLPAQALSTWTVLFDLFVMACLAAVLGYALRHLDTFTAVLLVAFTTVVAAGLPVYAVSVVPLLLLVFLAALFYHSRQGSWLGLIFAGVLAWMLFYLRPTSGMTALALLGIYGAGLWMRPHRQSRRQLALYALAVLLAGLLLALALDADLPGLARGALHLTLAYSNGIDVTGSPAATGDQWVILAGIAMAAMGTAFVASRHDLPKDHGALLRIMPAAVLLVISFWAAFTRPLGHPWLFFQVAAASAGLLVVFSSSQRLRARLSAAFVVVLVVSFPIASRTYSFDRVQQVAANATAYAQDLARWRAAPLAAGAHAKQRLPDGVLDIVGNSPLDGTPQQLDKVYTHGLNYRPLPVLRFQAWHDRYLDQLNRNRLQSSAAPEFFLAGTEEVGAQLPLLADWQADVALLDRYQLVGRVDPTLVLLRRAPRPRGLQTAPEPAFAGAMNELITLTNGRRPTVLKARVPRTLRGRLAELLLRPPLLHLTVHYANGETETHELTARMLEAGVLLNLRISDPQALVTALASDGGLGRKVDGFTLETSHGWAFREGFEAQLIRLVSPTFRPLDETIEFAPRQHLVLAGAGYDREGSQLSAHLWWEDSPLIADPSWPVAYTSFVHVVDGEGNRIAGTDVLLREDSAEVTAVQDGNSRFFISNHVIDLPEDLPPGTYGLRLGLYTLIQGKPVDIWSNSMEPWITVP